MIGSNLASHLVGLVGRRQVAAGVAFAIATTAMVVAAVASDGTPATNVNLDDGSVWVTNNQTQRVGRLVVRINELDLAIASGVGGDVVQDGRSVFFTGVSGGVSRLDVISGQPSGRNEIPIANYQVRGGIGLVLDRESGNLWVGSDRSIVAPEYPDDPDAIIDPSSIAVATVVDQENVDTNGNPRGRVLIVGPSGWYELALDDGLEPVREPMDDDDEGTSTTSTTAADDTDSDGTVENPPPPPIKAPEMNPLGVPFDEVIGASTVGDMLVLLLTDGRVVVPGGEPQDVPGDDAVLQQPGPAAESAIVASSSGLFTLDLESGEIARVASAGAAPAAPVRVGPCIFGAWSGETPSSFKSCSGVVLRDGDPIPNASPNVELVFRVNQRNVALNSPGDGGMWADHEGDLAYVGNWADVQDDTQNRDDQDDATGESLTFTERVCLEGGGAAPTAGDDELGVRPRQSIVDVLNNDDDANCEPIAITSVTPEGDTWGQLTIINNGQHLLYSPSDEMLAAASESIQSFKFQYTVEDSSGNKSSPATVSVTVKDRSLGNTPPQLRPKSNGDTRKMRAIVEEGRSISYDVLADWWDPDGDDLRLADAVSEGLGEASGTSDGIVRFAANGVPPSIAKVAVTITDGELSATESLEVTVKPTGSPLPPLTSTDFLTLVEGSSDVIYPLANDSDPNENRLEMRPLWLPEPENTFRTRMTGDGVEVTAIQAGTYLLEYDATDGVDATRGAIRLVVLSPNDVNSSPIAVPDTVQLRVDRVVNVDVLANDIDEDGDILAVTQVSASANDDSAGIVRASVVDRRLIQLEVVPGPTGEVPTGPFWVSYTVSDGFDAQRAERQSADQNTADSLRSLGGITVTIQPSSVDQPPILNNDAAVVRSGDIVQVPVLRNDIDPDSDTIVLESVDADQAAALEEGNAGVVWTEGRFVYFQGGEPGRYSVLYNVSAAGRRATAEVSFEVTPLPSPTNINQAPSPPDLVLRAVRNGTVRLQVPLFGSDADGDSVFLIDEFTDLEGSANGSSVSVDPENPQFILFTAGSTALATDSFTYSVEDRFGERGSATVSVVVLDDAGWSPQAHDDVYSARPGRTLSIPLLANDSSPSDRPLEIAELPFFDLNGEATASPQNPESVKLLDQSVPEQRGRIEVVVPTDGSTLIEHYRISDGRNPSDAFLRVTPDPDAPNLPPVAGVDIVESSEVAGLAQVEVEVLLNDFDPDDANVEFQLEIPAGQDATVSGGVVTVPLTQRARTVLYRITDTDGASAVGVIRVPGSENHPPVLSEEGSDPTRRTIKAGAGGTLRIDLADIVEDPDGDTNIRLTPREVRVLGELGSVTRLDDGSGFVYEPPPDLRTQAPIGIQFEVTDRPNMSLDERQLPDCNCVALLTVELIVEASSPPRILSQGAVSVPQLDEEVSYDLAPLVVDDQGDPLTFDLDPGSFGGLEVTQSGSVISLVARQAGDEKIPIGTTIPIRFSVTDGNFEAVEGTVVVTMIATNKGQPSAGTLPVQEAERDTAFTVPGLVSIAFNPFPERPLTLASSTVDGGASIVCNEQGDCEFLSNSVGTFTVGYVLKDAVDQTANGGFTVVVKGKPRPPGVPSIESVGNYVVNLSWTAADMQGGDFVKYIVTAVETGATREFTNTGGQFDGLINGDVYRFTVVAENELGLGEVSGPSSPAIPDRVPDPPVGTAIVDYQDSQLTLQWSPPPTAGDFTPIQQYEVSIGGQVLTVDGSTTSLVVGAGGAGGTLQNGTDYTFRVRAQNAATVNNGWGDWSGLSGSERPSRYPDPPTSVVAVNSGDGGTPRLTVSWLAPAFDGGRAVTSYEVCMSAGPCQTISSGTVATFDTVRQQSSSFTVIAFNSDKNRNNSDPATSPAVIAVGDPDVPVISSVTSGNRQVVATATTTNNSGCSTVSIQYSRDAGANWQTSDGTFSSLVNGTAYTIVARAVLGTNCGTPGVTYQSANSAGTVQTPYGPLVQPTMNVSISGNVITWTWSANRADDGRPTWAAALGGECAGDTLPNGNFARDYGYNSGNRTCTITISASGVPSLSASATSSTPPPPPPTVTHSPGSLVSPQPTWCSSNTCRFNTVSGSNFPPNTSVSYRCGSPTGWVGPWTLTTTDSGGRFGPTQSVCIHAPGTNQDVEVTVGAVVHYSISTW